MPEKNNNFRACVKVVGGFGVIRHIDQLIKPLLPLLNVFVQATFLTTYEESPFSFVNEKLIFIHFMVFFF